MAKKDQDTAKRPGDAPGLQKTAEILGGSARISSGRSLRSKAKGVVAAFPNGYVARAGFRLNPRPDAEVWEDAEADLLDGSAAWYGPDGLPAENPAGGGFSSLGEFAVRASASGVF